MIGNLLDLFDFALLAVFGGSVAWLATLTLVAALPPRRRKTGAGTQRNIAVVVPAHDEEAGIATTVVDLALQHYPLRNSRVVVVADNCSDRTTQVAREQGAEVWERRDLSKRGKGYALRFAFDRLIEEGWADAIAVVDADTRVEPGFLAAMDRALEGAECVQGRYRVLNPDGSWRTRIMALALGFAHHVRPLGRCRLGFGAGLKGNGMAFRASLLRRIPWDAFSRTEDIEFDCRLAEAGVCPAYEPEAVVLGAMPAEGAAAAVQRRRWEEGRRQAAGSFTARLLRAAIRRFDPRPLEMALHLTLPPLAMLVAVSTLALAADLALGRWAFGGSWAVVLAALSACVAASPALSGEGRLADLARAPGYVFWKAILFIQSQLAPITEWQRTPREVNP